MLFTVKYKERFKGEKQADVYAVERINDLTTLFLIFDPSHGWIWVKAENCWPAKKDEKEGE